MWAEPYLIYDKFKIDKSVNLSITNTSFQYIRKCKEAEQFYLRLKKNFDNPIERAQLKNQWWLMTQPDELYITATLAQMGITGKPPRSYVFFGTYIDKRPIHELEQTYPIISIYGRKGWTRDVYTDYYDKAIFRLHKQQGTSHFYKYSMISMDRYFSSVSEPVFRNNDTVIRPGVVPIAQTLLIDSSKLIQSYPNPFGTNTRVSNYLNCSVINYRGKTYFAYRMEMQPFCTIMKIAICLIDENLQPIEGTSVIPTLHSDLKGYAKGFHVEDPRLFIHNDELYLSYTDGYQMGQAKINPDTLEAENSYYLTKPEIRRTEKNWIPISEGEKLYSIYDIQTMRTFEMEGSEYKEAFQLIQGVGWEYGELRGGTPPIEYNDNLVMFFHSRTSVTVRGREGYQYHMGALVTEKEYPFKPLAITTRPLISGEKVSDHIPRLSNSIYVVFPCGVIKRKEGYAVSFGYNDYQCRVVNITEKILNENLCEIVLTDDDNSRIEAEKAPKAKKEPKTKKTTKTIEA